MEEYINKLKEIKKEEIDERTFYKKVLETINDGVINNPTPLTPENFEELKKTLLEIGCMRYEDWEKTKRENGEEIAEEIVGEGIEKAGMPTAVNFVSQFLSTYSNATFCQSYLEDRQWIKTWLESNNELYKETEKDSEIKVFLDSLKGIKKEELDERSFYEQVLHVIKGVEHVELTPRTAEQLKTTLREIGCVNYSEWKREKEENEIGFREEETTIGAGIEKADIGTAVSFVSQLLGDYSNAIYSKSRMLDGGEKYGWVQTWLKNSKMQVPYNQVAKEALMNWNGLSEEEALKIITNSAFEQIEGQVWAKGSIDYAIEGISEALVLTDSDKEKLTEAVYHGKNEKSGNILKYIKPEIERIGENPNKIIMDTLFKVHDGWVKDNAKKFMARDKKHQHMPSELIGWKEVKADLLFVKPIFEAAGIEVNEQELEAEYNKRVKEFFLNNKIRSATDLVNLISQGESFYPVLEGYGDTLISIKDPRYVMENVIPAIENKGIGKIEDIRANILSEIAKDPKEEDIARLSKEEMKQMDTDLDLQIETLTEERKELRQKNSIIERIKQKAKERKSLKRAIALEKSKKEKTIKEFND